jgi:quercetin dioxygenase-like cupin family protein
VHEGEDENNYILDGHPTMHIGDQTFEAGPGSYVVAPRGIRQQFKNNGAVSCRFLTMFTPGGAEGFFMEAGALIAQAAPGKPDPADLARLQRKYRRTYL